MPRSGRHNWREPPEQNRTAFIYDSDEGVETRIGNPYQLGFSPEISLRKWDGESFLKLLLPSPPFNRVPIIDEDQKIEIDYNSHQHRWFIRNDPNDNQFEAFEWEIVFPSKPSSNIIEYNIETENLVFYRQDLQEHPPHPVIMPDNVIGSYAVYHSSKAHNKYKTGKVCHIYRPKAIDASSHEVWCDLFIDPVAGILRITVPQDFIDNAVYPIIIDPTFGHTTLGGAEVGVTSAWCYGAMLAVDFYTASSGDNVNELFVGIRSPNEFGDDMAMAIYTIFKSKPKAKVMVSDRFAVSNVSTWYSIEIDQDLDDGKTYCVAAGEFSAGTWWFRYDYNIVGSSENGSTFPQTWSGVTVPHRFSMYAEYTEAGGDVFVTPDPASAVAAKVDPTVILGSIAITPSPISAVGSKVDPAVILGSLSLTPSPAAALAGKVDPAVILGSLSLTPSAVSAVAGKNDPSVILGSITVAPSAISAISGKVDPTVILGSISLTASAAAAIASKVDPTVLEGALIVTPDPVAAIAGKLDPTIILGSTSATPTPVSAVSSKVDPTVVLPSMTVAPSPVVAIAAVIAPTVVEGGILVTPTPVSSVGTVINPTIILGSISLTPTAISAIGAVHGPTVIEGGNIVFTPNPAGAVAGRVNPSVILGSISLTPDAISAISSSVSPIVVLGSMSVAPDPASGIAGINAPVVILGSLTLTPEAITAIADRSGPTILFGSTTATPAAAAAIGAKLDPSIILSSMAVTPNPVVVIATKNDPTVWIGVLVTGLTLAEVSYGAGLSASDIEKGSTKGKSVQYGGLTMEED